MCLDTQSFQGTAVLISTSPLPFHECVYLMTLAAAVVTLKRVGVVSRYGFGREWSSST
jgi:hypothetical protein